MLRVFLSSIHFHSHYCKYIIIYVSSSILSTAPLSPFLPLSFTPLIYQDPSCEKEYGNSDYDSQVDPILFYYLDIHNRSSAVTVFLGQNNNMQFVGFEVGRLLTLRSAGVKPRYNEKPVRIIPGYAGIVQAARLREQADIKEGGEESVMSAQKYIRKVVEDVGEDEDFKCGS
ncbi:hypothetical protein Tco_1108144 [Tanacetum coccineum]